MNLGELSVRKNRVVFVLMFLVLLGGFVAYRNLGRLEDPEFTIKEALIITPYPGASAEEVAQGSHQSDRNRLPATGPTQARRVGIHAGTIRGDRRHPGPISKSHHSAGVGRTSPQDQRRPIQAAAFGSRQVDGDRQFRRRLRHLSCDHRQGVLPARASPLRRVPPPRTAAGAGRQEGGSVQRTAGSRLPRDFPAAAGAAGHQ